MALRLQQALADFPITNLRSESVRSFLATLCSRFGLGNDGAPLRSQFFALLTLIWESNLGFWISDYVAVAAADPAVSAADPDEASVLSPVGVFAWCQEACIGLNQRIMQMLESGVAAPDHIIECSHATQSLLAVAQAVATALGAASLPSKQLTGRLLQLHETTQVLQWLEQLQQQRPGSTPVPLITRSSSFHGASAAAAGGMGAGAVASPNYASLAAWKRELESRRQKLPGNRLFLQDLLQQLSVTSSDTVSYPSGYPFPDVLTAVQELFLSRDGSRDGSSSSGSSKARDARLAVLQYYLLDGGWLSSATAFAQGFQLPLTLAQQWQCHYLLDLAHCSSSSSTRAPPAAAAAAAADAALDEACNLLGATACPDTPFRFVEVLLAAGQPTTALAVQRARCAGASSSISGAGSSGGSSSLAEARVLLRVQLGCGLLPEAFSELRRHCSQLRLPERSQHTQVLIQELAAWATAPQKQQQQQGNAAAAPTSTSPTAAAAGLSRLQALTQLPFNCQEEASLVAWLRQRMAAGQSGGAMLPMYLLQRGRTLEAVSAYSDYCASPAGTAAAAAAAAATAAGGGSADSAAVVQHRQLATLMSAAAASLPPALRATAIAALPGGASSGGRPVLQGLGFNPPAGARTLGSIPLVVLAEGAEPAVFASPLLPAAAGNLICSVARLAVDDTAAGPPAALPAAASASAGAGIGERQAATAAAATAAGFGSAWAQQQQQQHQQQGLFSGSLFAGDPPAAAAAGAIPALFGPGALGQSGLPSSRASAEPPSLFGPLFDTPAPKGSKTAPVAATAAAAADSGSFGGFAGFGGFDGGGDDVDLVDFFSTPAVAVQLSHEEFRREVLGLYSAHDKPDEAVAPGGGGGQAAAAAIRSSKRLRRTPEKFV